MARCARRPHAVWTRPARPRSSPDCSAVRAIAASPSTHRADAPAGNAITQSVVPGALIDERAGRQRLVGPSQGDLHGPGHVETRRDDEAIATGRHVLAPPSAACRRVAAAATRRRSGRPCSRPLTRPTRAGDDRHADRIRVAGARGDGDQSAARVPGHARRQRPPEARAAGDDQHRDAEHAGEPRTGRPAGDARCGAAPTIRASPRRTTPQPRSRPPPGPPETSLARRR